MTERQWTVVWVPHGAGGSRSVTVSERALKVIGSAAAVALLVVGGLGYTVIRKGVDISHLERVEKANQFLSQEVVRTRTLLREVNDTVAAITHRNELVRVLAGLPTLDPGVLKAGIGGPSAAASERELILGERAEGRAALQMQTDVESMLRRANLLARSFESAADSLKTHKDRLSHTPSIYPTRGWLSSLYAQARMHPIFHEARRHEGIDIAAPMGTPVIAPAGGLVIDVKTDEAGYGGLVTIDHGYGLVTRYAHLSKALVYVGQRVRRGDEIALVGNTGISTAPHLHYEVEVNGHTVDPRTYIFPESIVD
jgi:hypothetical protein